jgi:hypothetical protein
LVFVLGLHQKDGYVDLDKQDFPKINRNLNRIFVRHRNRSNIVIRPYYFDAAPGAPYPAECTYCFEIMWPRFNAMAGAITGDRWGACTRLRDNVCGWTVCPIRSRPAIGFRKAAIHSWAWRRGSMAAPPKRGSAGQAPSEFAREGQGRIGWSKVGALAMGISTKSRLQS